MHFFYLYYTIKCSWAFPEKNYTPHPPCFRISIFFKLTLLEFQLILLWPLPLEFSETSLFISLTPWKSTLFEISIVFTPVFTLTFLWYPQQGGYNFFLNTIQVLCGIVNSFFRLGQKSKEFLKILNQVLTTWKVCVKSIPIKNFIRKLQII